ncbi:MAG: ABC transporter ATP-binding protein [Clostridia bacterium]|nr:ABC transporter ATP-binding protein [Clostridia bacterium]
MAELNIIALTKTYPSGVTAVDNLSLTVNAGESVALFGLERSGKSTLLRMIAGLEPVTSGQIVLDGKDITDLSVKDRNLAYVFQNTTLDNNKTVYENLAYGLKSRKAPAAVIDVKVKAVAEILNLSQVLNRKPKTLTALERRRILLGRTVVRDPKVYLFDEALSGLNDELRLQILKDITKLQIALGCTFVYATENIAEAVTVASRVAILSQGKLLQIDTPENLYHSPANGFVAEIMGTPKQSPAQSDGE